MIAETILSCPLGHKCEDPREGKMHRCAWLVEIDGVHPTTQEHVVRKQCAMTWLPALLIDNTKVTRGSVAAMEEVRNALAATPMLVLPSMRPKELPG